MTQEELLKPRYKQINDWPFMGHKYKIGKIFTFENEVDTGIISKYPHLFRKLEWWEDREKKDMPKYVKEEDGQVFKVKEWDGTGSPYVFVDTNIHKGFREGCKYTPAYGVLPSTLSEYQSFLKQQTK